MNIENMLWIGESFHSVANEILPAPDVFLEEEDDSHWFIPYIVNKSFACELYLKCILTSSQISYNKGHNLETFFQSLPDEIKEQILNNPRFKGDNRFYEALHENSTIFYNWRYCFEDNMELQVDVVFLDNLTAALHDIAKGIIERQ